MQGVSGIEETTVSTDIVKTIGAIRVWSDVERARLFTAISKVKTEDLQDDDLYHLPMTKHTYDRFRELTRTLMQTGFSVVVDGTFLRQHERELFRRLAHEQACAWFIIDVLAPHGVLEKKLKRRS
jgi:uncharacterized protein